MNCPYCDKPESKVVDSRYIQDGIRRRRECLMCSLRFTTYEKIHTQLLNVIKRNDEKETFSIEKLTKSIKTACKKRPISIEKIEKISSFNLKSFNLRSYYHDNILAFGDLLHRIHPLAGQGFNMTIRDIKVLSDIIRNKLNLGLPLDISVNKEFEKKLRHNNFIFANGIDLVHEFFNFERKTNINIPSKVVQLFGKNLSINKIFTRIADKGIVF